jgi:hypothetical protein
MELPRHASRQIHGGSFPGTKSYASVLAMGTVKSDRGGLSKETEEALSLSRGNLSTSGLLLRAI